MRARHTLRADGVAGALMVLFGGWFVWQAFLLREASGFSVVGPRVFPVIIGLGFIGGGLALALARPQPPPAETEATDWRTLVLVVVLLAGYVGVFLPLGFLLASVLFFISGAWVLGSRSPLRDVVSAVLVVGVVYVVFRRLLGLELPAEPLDQLITLVWPV